MTNLDALYQEVILDHNRKPRNFREMENADRRIEGRNPLCGDEITVWLKLDGDRVADVSFKSTGCAVSKSSASLMTSTVKGKTVAETLQLFDRFHQMITGKLADGERDTMGSLAALGGRQRRRSSRGSQPRKRAAARTCAIGGGCGRRKTRSAADDARVSKR